MLMARLVSSRCLSAYHFIYQIAQQKVPIIEIFAQEIFVGYWFFLGAADIVAGAFVVVVGDASVGTMVVGFHPVVLIVISRFYRTACSSVPIEMFVLGGRHCCGKLSRVVIC